MAEKPMGTPSSTRRSMTIAAERPSFSARISSRALLSRGSSWQFRAWRDSSNRRFSSGLVGGEYRLAWVCPAWPWRSRPLPSC